MRLELGSAVRCSDGPFGELADVVIDPVERGDPEPREIVLRATAEDVRRLEPIWELAYLRLSEAPLEDPDWDVGTEGGNPRKKAGRRSNGHHSQVPTAVT